MTYTATKTKKTSGCSGLLGPMVYGAIRAVQARGTYPQGTTFFVEGQTPTGIFLIHSGRVRLSTQDHKGRRLLLGYGLPGDILGLSAAISGQCHEETAQAEITTAAGFIECQDFLRLLNTHAEAAFWIVQLLSDRLGAAFEQLCHLQQMPFWGVIQ
jgi:CRP/FNR family transcriptional regulator, polysaccharide utilization system transcription regulator